VTALLTVRDTLSDENHDLTTENKKLRQKKSMDEEMIAHKLKMREEQVEIDSTKKIAAGERAADERVATVKDEYRDKLETQLKKRGDELKELFKDILKRLPDVNLAIKQKN
jgi:hypothetical protein